MKIIFNKNSNILYYKVADVLEGIKQETEENKVFFFDSNFSQLHFFNYFLESLEEEERYEESKIIKNHVDKLFSNLPKDLTSCVDYCINLVEYDDEIEKIFSVTTPQVICAFLFTNFYVLIYDEFYFFYQKNILLKELKEKLKTENIQQIIYEIILQVSYKLKQQVGQKQFEFDATELNEKDLQNLQNAPKDLTSAIDWLIESVEKNGTILEKINFDGTESVDILTCTIYGQTNHILLYSWYLYHKDSPLKVWFETNRKINEPFYMVYYLVRNFVNFLLLKYSTNV